MNMTASKYDTAREYLKDCYFIRINPDNKKPMDGYGGYPESKPENPPLEENPNVYRVENLPDGRCWYGLLAHRDRNLIILDIDCYKPEYPDGYRDCEFIKRHEREGMVVESQSGGKHIYIQFDGNEHPDDIELALPAVEEKGGLPGNSNKGYGITPIDSPYELIADNAPLVEDRDSLLESPFYHEVDESEPTHSEYESYEPEKTRDEILEIDTTSDVEDIFEALNATEPDDVPLPDPVGYRDGYGYQYDPRDFGHYRGSKSGETLEYQKDGEWYDQKESQPLNTFDVWCAYHEIVDKPWHNPTGSEFWKAVDDFRSDGAPIPEFTNNPEPRECDPPEAKFVEFDKHRIRENEIPEAIETYRRGDEVVIIGHTGGSGKTITTIRYCVENDIPFVMFFHNHDLIREVLEKDACPLHPDHDDVLHLQGQPHLCTIPPNYKSQFEKINSIGGPGLAHRVVEPHDEKCDWQKQFGKIDSHDFVFAPHEYQGLDRFGGKMPIVDERAKPVWKTHRNFSVDDIREFADVMRDWHGELDYQKIVKIMSIYEKLADYADGVAEYIETGENIPTLNVSPATLARTKIRYNRCVLENPDLPMIYDALMAFADELEVVNVPPFLNRCPQCSAGTHPRNGIITCNECGWNENGELLNSSARAGAKRTFYREPDVYRLEYRKLRETPLKPLILDATYDTRQTELLYDADVSDVYGDENYERNCYTTQLVGGQYHASTAKNEYPQKRFKQVAEAAVRRFENPLFFMKEDVFDRAKELYPNFWTKIDNVMAYGEHRGVTRKDCDAVFVFGALHPDLLDLQFKADILGADTGGLSAEHLESKNLEYQKINYTDEDGQGREVPTKTFGGYLGHRFQKIRQDALEQASFRIRAVTSDEPKYVFLLTSVPTDLQIDRLVTWDELLNPLSLELPDGAIELARQLDGEYSRPEILDDASAPERTVEDWLSKLVNVGLADKDKSGFPCQTTYQFDNDRISDITDISERTVLRPDRIDHYREQFDIQW